MKDYHDHLLDNYNVLLVWQVPRSMEFNMLDLGVWMAVHSWVEKCHRGRRSNRDALWFTIEQAWHTMDSRVFANVYERWKKVLKIVVADDGDNKLVDTARGEFMTSVILPAYEAAILQLQEADAAEEAYNVDDDEDEQDADGPEEEQEILIKGRTPDLGGQYNGQPHDKGHQASNNHLPR